MKNNSDGDENAASLFERLTAKLRPSPKTAEDVAAMVDAAGEREIIDKDAQRIIAGALEVSEMHARDIMIPRTQMVVLKAENSFDDTLQEIIETAHSRYPVIGESMDEILGILLAKDLLSVLAKDHDDASILDLLRPAVFVPESKRLNVLLKNFREERNHMALVIDEYGTLSGLVTIEDVLEEIVGEIEDEHDREDDPSIRKMSGGHYIVKALTPIDEFNDYFDSRFEDDEFDTIGGIIINHFGHLPQRNEEVDIEGFHVKVLRADNRRLHSLRLSSTNGKNSARANDTAGSQSAGGQAASDEHSSAQ